MRKRSAIPRLDPGREGRVGCARSGDRRRAGWLRDSGARPAGGRAGCAPTSSRSASVPRAGPRLCESGGTIW